MALRALHACLLVFLYTTIAAASDWVHPGTIKDCASEIGLRGAEATAWKSTAGERDKDCPTFAVRITYDTSDSEGSFHISVWTYYDNFVMTYCKDNYVSRVEESNKNDTDGSRIAPDPILLCSRDGATSEQYAMKTADNVNRDVQSNVTYLSEANASAFGSVLEKLPFAERKLLSSFVRKSSFGMNKSMGFGGVQGVGVDSRLTARIQEILKNRGVAVATTVVVQDLKANLIYLSRSLKYFSSALQRYPAIAEYLASFEKSGYVK